MEGAEEVMPVVVDTVAVDRELELDDPLLVSVAEGVAVAVAESVGVMGPRRDDARVMMEVLAAAWIPLQNAER